MGLFYLPSSLSYSTCANSFTSKPASVATRSELSSGRLSLMSTALTQPGPTKVIPICSSNASMCTTTRPLVDDMFPVPSSWTLSPVPWTPSALVLLDSCSEYQQYQDATAE